MSELLKNKVKTRDRTRIVVRESRSRKILDNRDFDRDIVSVRSLIKTKNPSHQNKTNPKT